MLLFVLCACVRDKIPICPPLTVYLEVEEKNYGNIDDLGGLVPFLPEDRAFREYIPTLHCELVDANTGQVVEKMELFDVPTDEAAFFLNLLYIQNLTLVQAKRFVREGENAYFCRLFVIAGISPVRHRL